MTDTMMTACFRCLTVSFLAILMALPVVYPVPASAADEGRMFVIAGSDGYGVDINECFSQGIACGRVVADAWCESHGAGPAKAFGLASDITASISIANRGSTATDPGAVIITCAD